MLNKVYGQKTTRHKTTKNANPSVKTSNFMNIFITESLLSYKQT